jgi:trimeric autotransporter adhesin
MHTQCICRICNNMMFWQALVARQDVELASREGCKCECNEYRCDLLPFACGYRCELNLMDATQSCLLVSRCPEMRRCLHLQVKGLRSHLAVLLRKAGNDDRLIAALQSALRRQPGGSTDSSVRAEGSSAATADTQGAAMHTATESGGGSAGRLHSANVLRLSSIGSASGSGRREPDATRAAMPDAAAAESEHAAQSAEAAEPGAQPVAAAVPQADVAPGCDSDEADTTKPPDAAASDAEAAAQCSASQATAPLSSAILPPCELAAHGSADVAAAGGARSVAAPQTGVDSASAVLPDVTATLLNDAGQGAASAEQVLQVVHAPVAALPAAPVQPAAVHAGAELADEQQPESGDTMPQPIAAPATVNGTSATAAAAEQTAAAPLADADDCTPAVAAAVQGPQADAVAAPLPETEKVENAQSAAVSTIWAHPGAAACSDAFEIQNESVADSIDSLRPAGDSVHQTPSLEIADSNAAEADESLKIDTALELQTENNAPTGDETAVPADESADEEQLATSSGRGQGSFVAAMAAAFGRPDDVMDADSGAAAAVQSDSVDDGVDAGAAATAGAESGLVDDFDDGLQLGDVVSMAGAATEAAAAASAAFTAAAEAAAAAAAAAAQAAAAEVLLAASGTGDVPTPVALADAGSDVAALPPDSDIGASNPTPLQADTVSSLSQLQTELLLVSSAHVIKVIVPAFLSCHMCCCASGCWLACSTAS